MYKKLESTIEDLKEGFSEISSARKRSLEEVARFVNKEIHSSGGVKINFICTHNSRRSQMAQIWTQAAAEFYGLKGVETFSGGVETTEFDSRAVDAIKRAGFRMRKSGDDNPEYHIRYGKGQDSLVCYSKTFNDPGNPSDNFAAILTCSQAEEKCPIIPGAEYRQLISYDDPKKADGTDKEEEVYDERCIQIGTEIFYMMSKAAF
jgi:protein-tyrosine-phosphatase